MFYRLIKVADGTPYTGGMVGIYRGEATIAQEVDDLDASDLEDEMGFPLPGWVWWPTGNLNTKPVNR